MYPSSKPRILNRPSVRPPQIEPTSTARPSVSTMRRAASAMPAYRAGSVASGQGKASIAAASTSPPSGASKESKYRPSTLGIRRPTPHSSRNVTYRPSSTSSRRYAAPARGPTNRTSHPSASTTSPSTSASCWVRSPTRISTGGSPSASRRPAYARTWIPLIREPPRSNGIRSGSRCARAAWTRPRDVPLAGSPARPPDASGDDPLTRIRPGPRCRSRTGRPARSDHPGSAIRSPPPAGRRRP